MSTPDKLTQEWRRCFSTTGLCLALLAFSPPPFAAAETKPDGWVRGKELAWSPFSSVTNLVPRYHAIVIGINDYGRNPPIGWNSLTTARQDAEAVAEVLAKNYGFKVTRLLDKEATRDGIMQALDQLVTMTVDDAVLVYYAGHGFFDDKLGEGFWIPYNARQKVSQKMPREDWIWNSTLTKIVGASEARHVLVISDSCYSGSLFRGGDSTEKPDFTWYRRAMARPSRYLITSGDMEPVLDSGTKHSIFAQNFLNCLNFPDKNIFSASELGLMIRTKVGTLTGQMVRMGPLSVPAHAGGEFVFLAPNASLADLAGKTGTPSDPVVRGGIQVLRGEPLADPVKLDPQQVMKDVSLMNSQGATNAAQNLLAVLQQNQPDNAMAKAMAAYFNNERREKSRVEIHNLLEKIEKKKAASKPGADDWSTYARPRILACIGPDNISGSTDGESQTLLCRIGLRSALQQMGRTIVVERETLQTLLQEMELGSSDLADKKAQTAIGKLLPAGLMLMGDLVPQKSGDKIYMRLVDTETTRVLATFSQTLDKDSEVSAVCDALATQIVAKAVVLKPLVARVVSVDGKKLKARVGRFHGASDDTVFTIVQRTYAKKSQDDFTEKELGVARLAQMDELESTLEAEQPLDVTARQIENLWVREKTK